MKVVTLTSDWQDGAYYSGAIKGSLLSKCPEIQLVDINHKIEQYAISEAMFVLRNSFAYFPKGSVHLVCVNTDSDSIVIISYQEHYFIGPASKAWGLLFNDSNFLVRKIALDASKISSFPELHIYPDLVCEIVQGNFSSLGESIQENDFSMPLRAAYDDSIINASVIYIDSYKNAITNVSKDLFDRVGNGRDFEITIKRNSYKVTKITKRYQDVEEGSLIALFNSCNLLEIAITNGPLAELLNLEKNSPVLIKFR